MLNAEAEYLVRGCLAPMLQELADEKAHSAMLLRMLEQSERAEAALRVEPSQETKMLTEEQELARIAALKAGAAPTGSSAEDRTGAVTAAERTELARRIVQRLNRDADLTIITRDERVGVENLVLEELTSHEHRSPDGDGPHRSTAGAGLNRGSSAMDSASELRAGSVLLTERSSGMEESVAGSEPADAHSPRTPSPPTCLCGSERDVLQNPWAECPLHGVAPRTPPQDVITQHQRYWLYRLQDAIEAIETHGICRCDLDCITEAEDERVRRFLGVLQDYAHGYVEDGPQDRISAALTTLLDTPTVAPGVAVSALREQISKWRWKAENNTATHWMLSALISQCADELETLCAARETAGRK